MTSGQNKISGKNHYRKEKPPPKDPEHEAEILYAKENGFAPPKFVNDKIEGLIDIDGTVLDKNILKTLKNGRAERKARSRGISGCSIKKDGNRFEYGLDSIELEDDVVVGEFDSSDEEFYEYSDFVVKYSEGEIREIIGEYLLNGNLDDSLMESLQKFCFNKHTSSRMTKDVIIHSIDHGADGGIELGIKLVADLINREYITEEILTEAMEELANSLESLVLDSPKINNALAIFMAKLVEYKIWEEKTIKLLAGRATGNGANIEKCFAEALTLAKNHYLLEMAHPPVGPCENTQTLSSQFKQAINGFVQGGENAEAVGKRLVELKVPHFMHEFVYQAGIMVLERMNDTIMSNVAGLLKSLLDDDIISKNCVEKGFNRLYDSLTDLILDLPAVYILTARWSDKALKVGAITEELANKCPKATRARARTLSQGPDGKLSCANTEEGDEGISSDSSGRRSVD